MKRNVWQPFVSQRMPIAFDVVIKNRRLVMDYKCNNIKLVAQIITARLINK